jgi:hypothetical protein
MKCSFLVVVGRYEGPSRVKKTHALAVLEEFKDQGY